MAYLKGGTVVDGNLYVEGGLRVKQIVDSSGKKMPHLEDENSSVSKRLVKFTDPNASIRYSLIEEDYLSTSGGTEKITFKDRDNGSEPVHNVLLSMNDVQFFSIVRNDESENPERGKLSIGGSSIRNIEFNTQSIKNNNNLDGSIIFNTATDDIIIANQSSKKLVGLKRDNLGSISVNGVTYRELTTAQYITEIPDIFIYKVPASSNA